MSKPKKIKLTIPDPCHEDWDKMTPNEKGKFCSHCSKAVIDFANYTDKELLEFFSKTKEKVCGRLNTFQVDRVIAAFEPSDTSLFKRLLFGAALTTGVAGTLNGQSIPHNQTSTIQPLKVPDLQPLDGKPHSDIEHVITGVILDLKTQQPIPFANIILMQDSITLKNSVSFAEGYYTIQVDSSLLNKTVRLVVEREGYESTLKELKIDKFPIKNFDIALMQEEYMIMGCIVGTATAVEEGIGTFSDNAEIFWDPYKIKTRQLEIAPPLMKPKHP